MSGKRIRFIRDRLTTTLQIDAVINYPGETSEVPHVAICCLAGALRHLAGNDQLRLHAFTIGHIADGGGDEHPLSVVNRT